jgi:starch synthase
VQEFDLKTGDGSGFTFEEYRADHFFAAIKRGLSAYRNTAAWEELVKKDMGLDFSWKTSAKDYIDLFRKILK